MQDASIEILPPEQQTLYKLLLKVAENQTNEIKSQIDKNINELHKKLREKEEEIEKLKKLNSELTRKNRKNNIVLFGITVKENEDLLNITLRTLNNNLNTTYTEGDINNIYKLGKTDSSPIIVEFISYLRKLSIYKNKEKLKELKQLGIGISNDMSKEDRENLKVLRTHLSNARSQNLSAYIKGFTLFINNKPFSVQDLITLQPEGSEDSSSEEYITESEEVNEVLEKQITTIKGSKQIISKSDNQSAVVQTTSSVRPKRKRNRKSYQYSPVKTRSLKLVK